MARIRFVTGCFYAGGLVAALSCSGGDGPAGGGSAPPPPPPTVKVLTGRMIDDPVQGLAYQTEHGAKGLTGPNGEYNYVQGEWVDFFLGTRFLARVPAKGIVTPIDMAANPNMLQNLLVLFQSLDQDGNPFNGIVIPEAASQVFTRDMMPIGTDPALFASSSNIQLVAAQAAAGITTGIVHPAQASASFLNQFLQLFALKPWVFADASEFALIRSDASGNYLMGQASPADALGGTPGVEVGRMPAAGFDRFGWVWSRPTLTLDNNGTWGMSNVQDCERVNVRGDHITFNDCHGQLEDSIDPMENDATGIVGAWALGSATTVVTPTILFFKNGQFGLVDPVGDTSPSQCGGPGVEFGSYTYDATTKVLKVSNLLHDTNGCAGLSGTAAATPAGMTFTLGSGATTATYNDGTVRTLHRVSQ